jgi:hypothetical protein
MERHLSALARLAVLLMNQVDDLAETDQDVF